MSYDRPISCREGIERLTNIVMEQERVIDDLAGLARDTISELAQYKNIEAEEQRLAEIMDEPQEGA